MAKRGHEIRKNGTNMWHSKRKKTASDFDDPDVLHLASNAPRSAVNRIFLARLILTLCVCLIGLGAILILTWQGARSIGRFFLFDNELFRISSVKIDCDGEFFTPKLISEYLALNTCSNLFAFNMVEERRALLAKVPRLKNAGFSRRLPGELIIIVHERLPVARLDMGSYYLSLDNEGRILGTSPAAKQLPVIAGHELALARPGIQISDRRIIEALEVIHACDTTSLGSYIKIANINVASQDFLLLNLNGGEQVKFSWRGMHQSARGSQDSLIQKLAMLAESLRSASARGKKIATLDMTVENNFPAIEY
jgi:cell division septal protein FtsQ